MIGKLTGTGAGAGGGTFTGGLFDGAGGFVKLLYVFAWVFVGVNICVVVVAGRVTGLTDDDEPKGVTAFIDALGIAVGRVVCWGATGGCITVGVDCPRD